MAIKKCLMKGEMTKVNKAVDKRKPATRKDQRLAKKQEDLFGDMFVKMEATVGPKLSKEPFADIALAMKKKMKIKGVKTSQAKVNRMLKRKIKPKGKIKPPKKISKISKEERVTFYRGKDQKIYDKYYSKYMDDPKLRTKKDFRIKWRDDVSKDIQSATTDWKLSSTRPGPTGLKMKAENMEMGIDVKTRLRRGYSPENRRLALQFGNRIKNEDYLKTRALHQAYMNKNNIKEVTLYRGVGGKTGVRLAKEIKRLDIGSTVTINQNSLVGYTSKQTVADSFGVMEGGVTLKIKVKSAGIVLHDDLWWDLFGDVYKIMEDMGLDGLNGEKEFMCLGKKLTLKIKDVVIK